MRKTFLCLFVALMAMTATLKAQTIVFTDGFESGNLSKWTQENGLDPKAAPATLWAVESENLAYPETAFQGTHRAYLRNTSGETQGYVTRLVSPVMRLDTVYQPLLRFYYANPKWTADRDTLRVLYRTGANAKWNELAKFADAKKDWTYVEMLLPEYNETYQIAFEGKDNLGRGIVLDSIVVRSTPECTVPHDFAVTPLGAGKVNLAWTASWDANEYELIVLKEKIDPDTIANVPDSVIDYHAIIDGAQQNYDLQLVSGEYYYAYMRSICDDEKSYWNSEDPAQSGAFYFRVKATKYVPYSYDFNYPYHSGYVTRNLEWTWQSNGTKPAFINVGTAETDWWKYSNDSTTTVVFAEGNSMTTPVPAHKYSYLASPALADPKNANFALNQCQVRFWTTVYTYTGRLYAHSLIVGVMTDPEDITTFEPVDTVSVWGTSTFVENIVDLAPYQGQGVYIAFMSNFDKQNLIFLDNVTVEYKPALQKVTKINVNPRDTYADISWEGNAPAYNVLITNELVVNPDKAAAAQIVAQVQVNTNSYKCEALEADHSWNRPYYVYVQAVNGENKTDWSYRYPFVTIAAPKAMPYSIDFEQETGTYYTIGDGTDRYPVSVGIFSNNPEYPHLNTSNYHGGASCLYLSKGNGKDSWITLPMIDSIPAAQIKFHLSGASTPAQAHATVGVMTNPMDINTFVPVSDFTIGSSGYTVCYANFSEYPEKDGVIAIVWTDVDGKKQTINYIDDITIEEIQKCLPPVNVQVEAQSDSVTVTWNKSDATQWEFVLATEEVTEKDFKATLDSIARMNKVLKADTLNWSNPLNKPYFGFGGLESNSTYILYLRTLCGEDKAWWSSVAFKTPCPDNFPIPFTDDFEEYDVNATELGCWILRDYIGTGYPKILNLTTGATSGHQLELWSAGTTHRTIAALPGVDGQLSNMVLSFTTRSWSTSAQSVIYVGTMGDFDDPSTFVPLDTFYNKDGNTFQQVRMDLGTYNLAFNNIVFCSGLDATLEMNSDVMVDNVVLKPNTCIEAWGVEATNSTTTSIDIAWKGKSTDDQWEIKVMQGKLPVKSETVTGKTYHIEDLSSSQMYTFFIKPICDTIWTEASFRTDCGKFDPSKANKEDFESITAGSATSQVPCWFVGNGTPGAADSYKPYVYSSTSNASSGSNSYRMYSTATYGPAYIVTPEIDVENMADLAVTFNMYAATSYGWACGVMSDPEDLSTFVTIDSIAKGTGNSKQYTYDLNDYANKIPATAKYFAWRTLYGGTQYAYLDDVSIIKVTCPLPKPGYSNLKDSCARISSGLRGNNEWIALVTTKQFDEIELSILNVDSLGNDSAAIADTIVVFYDTLDVKSKLIKGLEEQTTYYLAVATVCEDGISQWKTTSFTTPCKSLTPTAMGVITFSEAEGFVSGSGATRYWPCWTIGNKNGLGTNRIPYVYGTSGNYWHNGNRSAEFYTTAAQDGAYAITPEYDLDDISNYQVNFWGTAWSSGEHKLIVGVITDPSDLNTFVAVDTVTMEVAPSWLPFTIAFDKYEGDYMGNKGKNIMFLSEFGASNDVNITEISVEPIPSCRPVTSFDVDSVAEDVAVVSWDNHGSKYRILLADKVVDEKDKKGYDWLLDSIVTHTDKVEIKNLQSAHQYYLYAQNICGESDSSAISMAYANFFTDCPVVKGYPVPYYNTFDNNANGTGTTHKPDCWDGVQLTFDTVGTTQSYPCVNSSTTAGYTVTPKNYMYLYSYGVYNSTSQKQTTNTKTIAVAPKVTGNLVDYMVSFYARKSSTTNSTTTKYGSSLLIGYVTDATQRGMDSTFVKIGDVQVTEGTYQTYQMILADYVSAIPSGARLALKADWAVQGFDSTLQYKYASFYIDNFKIGMPPSCFPPTLEPGNTTLYTADVTIVPAKLENTKWQIAVVPDSIYVKSSYDAAKYLAGSDVRIVDADSANFVLSGLTPGTKYWLYGRTVCGGEDGNSEWSDVPVSTRTKYYYKDSFYFGFEKSEGYEFVYNSTSYYLHPALEAGYQGGNSTTSYTTYYPYSLINSSSAVYAYGGKPADGKYSDDASKWPDGMAALRWESSSTIYGGYVIFPAIDEPKDRSFEFSMRNCYMSFSTMKSSTPNENLEMEIGLVDKNKGFSNYEVIATVSMPKTNTATVASASNNYLFEDVTLDFDSATLANKQIVIRQPKQNTAVYVYIDNAKLGEKKGYGLVSIGKIHAEATTATVNWANTDGPWNLYILKANGDTLSKFENITDRTSQLIDGLSPQTSYTVSLVAANAPADTKYKVSDSKSFRTPCLPIEPDADGEFVWNFNDPNEWEQSDVLVEGNANNKYYFKPECFTVGTTYAGTQTTSTVYYNWLIQRKGYTYTGAPISQSTTATSTARYEYGRNDSPALRVYSSSTYMTPYIVLPELHCSFDTMMIEFYGRCFANYASDYGTATSQNKPVAVTYLGASYSKSIVVGTLTDPNDFSTLQVLDTVTYTHTDLTAQSLVTADPDGLRYWQKMQVPLSKATGKYIVLFQPAYGLMFVDDLSVKRIGDNLFTPKSPRTIDVTATTADVSVVVNHPSIQTVFVLTNQAGNTEIDRDTIQGTKDTVYYQFDEGLKANSAYQWYAYQTDGTNNTSNTARTTIYTECAEITPDYVTSFEPEEGWRILPAQTSATYKQDLCWTYENAGTSAVSTYIYNYASTNTAGYGRTGDYGLRLYATGTTYQTYAAMPAMDVAAYDTLQVNFWMRPGYHNPSTGKISTQYTLGSAAATKEYYYSRSIIVGTMTDPKDKTTFVPIDTVNYIGTLSTSDVVNEANDFLFQQKKVSLRGATGPYVAFMTTLDMKGMENKSTTEYMWLDDISFTLRQDCKDPTDLDVEEVAADSAKLVWAGEADKYVLQVNIDPTYPDTTSIFNDTVFAANSYVITGLKPHTPYVWRVKAVCGGELGESDFSQNAIFTTAFVPFWGEDFSNTEIDADWKYGTNSAVLVLDSTDVEISGANSTSYGFRRLTNDYGLTGAHYAVTMYSSSTTTNYDYDHYWMITPVISLSNTKISHLTFDIALTASTISTPAGGVVTEDRMADDFIFAVAVSDDGGKTWKKENILAAWCNALPAGSQLRNIPNKGMTARFDLSKYAGKNIRVAFYREAQTYLSSTCAVHIGNIRVIDYKDVSAAAEACQYEDIEEIGFFIDGDEAKVGETKYMRMAKVSDTEALKGVPDTVYTLNVIYNEVPITVIQDTICEGDSYSNYDFSGKTETGVYSRKVAPVGATACDSVARLYLYVRPREYTNLEYAICQGQTLVFTDKFIGQTLNTTGVYYDTLLTVNGCDSVLTLALTVVDAFRSEFNAAICAGTPYYWEAAGKSYTEPGDYTEKLITATGCDSIVTLHLKNNEVYSKTINVTICEGASYEFGGKVLTQAGQYVHTFESVLGCDSTVTLNLSISDMYRDTIEAEIMEGEAYKFYDLEYDTEGTYDIMRPGKDGDCDSLRVLVLTVKPEEAIDNVTSSELVLVPTILNAGETVRADYHFTKADLANLKVDVYDIVGRQVEAKKYEHQPIIIDAFPVAGVYTVRITTGTGLNLVGRVVVR